MYGLMAVISILIRNFVLPNPFECFGDSAFIINLIAELIIHAVAFGLVGLIYSRGEAPALGSILYLLAYAMITGFLFLLDIFFLCLVVDSDHSRCRRWRSMPFQVSLRKNNR